MLSSVPSIARSPKLWADALHGVPRLDASRLLVVTPGYPAMRIAEG
jgi:hypothetical protein